MVTAFALTLLAGAATTVGGLIALHGRVRSDRGLAVALGFAAGAMMLVSLVEIVPKGVSGLAPALGRLLATGTTLGLVVVGALGVVATARFFPTRHGDHPSPAMRRSIRRSGVLVAVAVSAHNLPEGLATFVTALEDPAAGVVIAAAIALHNVPEGVAVAAPFYGAGATRARALGVAALSGLAEPLGALLGYLVLAALLPESAYAIVFGLIAGVMLQLSLSELLPTAWRLAPGRHTGVATAAGAVLMGSSLLLLNLV